MVDSFSLNLSKLSAFVHCLHAKVEVVRLGGETMRSNVEHRQTEDVAPDIAARLRIERARLRLSARAIAESCGVSRSTHCLYEAGDRVPDARYLAAAHRIGVDVGYLLTGERAEELATRLLDWERLETVLRVVEQWLDERDLELPPQDKARVVRILFENVRDDQGLVNERKAHDLLSLVA